MSDYHDEPYRRRNGELARETTARREAEQDARDRAASLRATKAQIAHARQGRGEPEEPRYKPEREWSTTERQIYAAYGRKPVIDD